ncbi:hypothetical protein EDB92DRAFT_1943698 [Lactarius akahatsu]|uniref:Uncharacterized protein n=1 Tax=Lactarius akahatsu TaxID=416441 RepID=A0AAD4LLA4_9AGAM|nr:hypothetical protein EDB92DRAFT_1943698 [Lactarius akahatsu]
MRHLADHRLGRPPLAGEVWNIQFDAQNLAAEEAKARLRGLPLPSDRKVMFGVLFYVLSATTTVISPPWPVEAHMKKKKKKKKTPQSIVSRREDDDTVRTVAANDEACLSKSLTVADELHGFSPSSLSHTSVPHQGAIRRRGSRYHEAPHPPGTSPAFPGPNG